MDGMMYMNTHLKCVLSFRCVFDLDFFFIVVRNWAQVRSWSFMHIISDIQKNQSISKTTLNPKTTFKWVCMDIIPSIYSKSLTKDNNIAKNLLILHVSSKIQKLYGMENINIE